MIDSEQVPRGKGEKHPGEGDEIVSETICLQRVGAQVYLGDGVPIEEWTNECAICCLFNSYGRKVKRKRVLTGVFS